jgi:hypothetical protein
MEEKKVVPLHAVEALGGGERRYSSYSYLTSALDGGEWSASRPGRALPPGKEPRFPLNRRLGGPPEPVWTQRLEEKSSASVGDRTPVVQSVVRYYTDWATPTPNRWKSTVNMPTIAKLITLHRFKKKCPLHFAERRLYRKKVSNTRFRF